MSDQEKLKKILMESYRNKAKDTAVKKAIRKRIADKKKVKAKGKSAVGKVRAHNLKQPLHTEAAGALKAKKEKYDADDRVNDSAAEAAKPKPKKKKPKKDVFSVGLAVRNVLKSKDRGY